MNKKAARERALSGEYSIGRLRQRINRARGRGGTSRVNPQFTLEQALDIYESSLEGRPDEEVPRVLRPDPSSRSNRMKPTRDVLLMTNILRDTA